jgi:hypothetical protein
VRIRIPCRLDSRIYGACKRALLEDLTVAQIRNKFHPLIESESALRYSIEPGTGYEPSEVIPRASYFYTIHHLLRPHGTLTFSRLKPNDPYMGSTAPLTSKHCILYIYSTNIGTEYFKHALYSPVFFLFKMQFVS